MQFVYSAIYNRKYMKLLTEIYRNNGIRINGRTISRTAVRAVILQGTSLLMIHSAVGGDYKFPGGGVKEGETLNEALAREVLEECGTKVSTIKDEIGCIVEYAHPIEKDFDIFKMTSHYYFCDVENSFGSQSLDEYEEELGFRPVWIHLEDAIKTNKSLPPFAQKTNWLAREIFMLEYLQRTLF